MNPVLTTPLPTLNPWEVDPPSVDYEDPAGPPPSEEPNTTERPGLVYKGLHDKLIPIYCSILAAVVLGLLAFVIFKR